MAQQLSLFEADPPPGRRRLDRFRVTGHGEEALDTLSGEVYSFTAAAAALPWVEALHGDGMPVHEYVVFSGADKPGRRPVDRLAVDVLLVAIRFHPEAFDAYFRGYQNPMRYVELSDGLRYWRTVLRGTHMLNRCKLDSVEPPRRVDEGAKPLHWEGPPWAEFGSPWPPGYSEVSPGRYKYDQEQDWRLRYRCQSCNARFYPSPSDRPCPRCGLPADQQNVDFGL